MDARLTVKHGGSPDETRSIGKGAFEVFRLGTLAIGHAYFEPGWRWSEHVKPIVNTASCQAHHAGYILSGRMKIVMDDGSDAELGPGDYFDISPGHDAWVLGDARCEMIDFSGAAEEYAKATQRAAKAA